mgnify:CR=1 FL=1
MSFCIFLFPSIFLPLLFLPLFALPLHYAVTLLPLLPIPRSLRPFSLPPPSSSTPFVSLSPLSPLPLRLFSSTFISALFPSFLYSLSLSIPPHMPIRHLFSNVPFLSFILFPYLLLYYAQVVPALRSVLAASAVSSSLHCPHCFCVFFFSRVYLVYSSSSFFPFPRFPASRIFTSLNSLTLGSPDCSVLRSPSIICLIHRLYGRNPISFPLRSWPSINLLVSLIPISSLSYICSQATFLFNSWMQVSLNILALAEAGFIFFSNMEMWMFAQDMSIYLLSC